MERSQDSLPLLRQFREFYAELAGLRQAAQAKPADGSLASQGSAPVLPQAPAPSAASSPAAAEAASTASAVVGPPAGPDAAVADGEAATVRIWQAMAQYLDQKMYEVNLSPSAISHDHLSELLYILVAFADETFVCLLDWPGKDYWGDHLMELRLFRTQIAGQEIFRRIDKLLARKDFVAEELAAVYLMALALGFKGQYLRAPEAVETYRKKLFDRLLMANPDLRRDSQRLFPEAHRHTIVEGSPVRLPEPRTWWLVVAGIVATWLVLSTIAWVALTSSTRRNLAVTMNSLDRITGRQLATTTTGKWQSLPFYLQNGAFRAELPATGVNSVVSISGKHSFVVPLLVAVNAKSGGAQASSSDVKAWLMQGSTTFLTSSTGRPVNARAAASVDFIENPPSGITTGGAMLFFLVDLAVTQQELASHPQLIFPVNGVSGVAVTAVTLYLPQASTTGAQ